MKIVLANPQNTSRPTAIWTASEKRGNFYYVMSGENIQLVLYCPTKNGSSNERTAVLLAANDELIEQFKIQIDESTYEGPFSTDNRMEDASLISFIEGIRNSDFTISFGTRNYIISKSNAADVIPAFDPFKFNCNLFHNTNDVGVEINQLLQKEPQPNKSISPIATPQPSTSTPQATSPSTNRSTLARNNITNQLIEELNLNNNTEKFWHLGVCFATMIEGMLVIKDHPTSTITLEPYMNEVRKIAALIDIDTVKNKALFIAN